MTPMETMDLFGADRNADGSNIYVTEMSMWGGNGYPHPVTGEKLNPRDMFWARVTPSDTQFNDIAYFIVRLPDGTMLRVFND